MGKIGKAFIWSAAEQFGAKIISLLTQIVLARLLLPADFGVLAILLIVVNVADMIAQSGFGQAIIQKNDATDTTYSTALWLSLIVAAAMYTVIFLCSPFVAQFYLNEQIELFLKVVSLKLFIDSTNSIQRSILQKKMRFKVMFRASFTATLLAGIAGVICAVLGLGIWALIIQVILNSLFACIVMAAHLGWRPKFVLNMAEAGELFVFGWKMAATGILLTFNSGIVELIVGKVCSAEALGYYSQGRKYPVAVMGTVSNAICNVVFPMFAELKNDMVAFRAAVSKSLVLGTTVVAPITTLLIVTAEPLVALVLSEQWLPSVPIFQLACAPYLFILFQVVNLRAYMSLGRSDVYLNVHVVKVVLSLMFVPIIAMTTRDIYCVAAVAALVETLTIPFVDVAPAKRIYGFSLCEQCRLIAPIYLSCILAAIPALFVALVDSGYVLTLVMQAAIFIGSYLIIAKAMGIESITVVIRSIKSVMSNGRGDSKR